MKSDFELLTAFKAGDLEAFHRLARRHQVTIFNFFYMLSGTESAAEDLTRRVFTQMATERHRLPLDRKFLTSLFRFGYRHWILFTQSEAVSDRRGSNLLPAPVAAQNADTNALDQATAERLLSSLSNEQKLIVVLSETSGLSYREISDVVDISEQAVGRRMAEAFAHLREVDRGARIALPEPRSNTTATPVAEQKSAIRDPQ